jgi:hypothetical protein
MIKLHCQHKDEGGSRCDNGNVYIQNGVLIIPLRHHGELHTLAITLVDLERLMKQDKERRDPALRV